MEARAFLFDAVEIGIVWNAEFLRRREKSARERVDVAQVADTQRSIAPMVFRRAALLILRL